MKISVAFSTGFDYYRICICNTLVCKTDIYFKTYYDKMCVDWKFLIIVKDDIILIYEKEKVK